MNQIWFSGIVCFVVLGAESFGQRPLPAQEGRTSSGVSLPEPVVRWDFRSGPKDLIRGLPGNLVGNAKIEDGQLQLDGNGAYFKSAPLPGKLSEKTMVAQVFLDDLSQRAGGVLTVQSLNGVTFDSIVFAEDKPRVWNNGSEHGIRFKGVEGQEESGTPDTPIWLGMVYQKDGSIGLYKNGVLYRSVFNPGTPLQHFPKKKAEVLIGKRHEGGGNPYLKGRIGFAEIYNQALDEGQMKALYQKSRKSEVPPASASEAGVAEDLPRKLLFFLHEPYSEELVRKAERGEAQAQTDLGYAYYFGKGVGPNSELAASWYAKAAAQGNANALNNLGSCYESGQGVGQDKEKAVSLYRRAAEAGFAPAQDNYAVQLCRGTGVEKNVEEAFRWHLQAGRQGWKPAFARIACHYLQGSGVQPNAEKARLWQGLHEATQCKCCMKVNSGQNTVPETTLASSGPLPREVPGPLRIRKRVMPVLLKNPFGAKDVGDIDYDEIKKFGSSVVLTGSSNDENAGRWCGALNPGEPPFSSLEGVWNSRWNSGGSGGGWTQGTAQIRVSGDKVFILYEDKGKYLVEGKIENDQLMGKYMNLNQEKDAGPWVGKIVGNDRIDGQWARGRWDFRR